MSSLVDATKLLTSPGIFGIFSTYRMRPSYYLDLSKEERASAVDEVSRVTEEFNDKVLIQGYLTAGLCHSSDFLIRVHCEDLTDGQSFLMSLKKTKFGVHSEVIETLIGITKSLNYITKSKSQSLNEALGATVYSTEAPRYAIVIPIKKNAQWWNLSDLERTNMIEGHTRPTLPYLVNVKRKLYHATGLSDVDFITYFETNDLTAFNNLIIALASVPENTFHVRYGNPTTLGLISVSLADVVRQLS